MGSRSRVAQSIVTAKWRGTRKHKKLKEWVRGEDNVRGGVPQGSVLGPLIQLQDIFWAEHTFSIYDVGAAKEYLPRKLIRSFKTTLKILVGISHYHNFLTKFESFSQDSRVNFFKTLHNFFFSVDRLRAWVGGNRKLTAIWLTISLWFGFRREHAKHISSSSHESMWDCLVLIT